MQTRKLGKTDLEIVPMVFGGNVFGWTVDEATSFGLLDAFVDRGFNCIDTADVYSVWIPGHKGGESETILGKWFAQSGKRNSVVLATKIGMEMKDADGKPSLLVRGSVAARARQLGVTTFHLSLSHDAGIASAVVIAEA